LVALGATTPNNAVVTFGASIQFLRFSPLHDAFREYLRRWKPVLINLISSDVYTMASAISTCAVISYFPFTILLTSIVQNVFHFRTGGDLIAKLIEAYIPSVSDKATPAAIALDIQAHAGSAHLALISIVILLVSAIGVFIPIEVTLNRIWEAPKNMSFIKNQLVSFGVILICAALSLVSFLIGGVTLWLMRGAAGLFHISSADRAEFLPAKLVGFILSFALFFVVFNLLPNIRMPLDTTIRASVFTGVVWELGKYVFMWSVRKLDLSAIYGQYFFTPVVVILWSYVSAMIMVLGAELAHRELLSLRLFRPAYEEWKLLHTDGGGRS